MEGQIPDISGTYESGTAPKGVTITYIQRVDLLKGVWSNGWGNAYGEIYYDKPSTSYKVTMRFHDACLTGTYDSKTQVIKYNFKGCNHTKI